MKIFFLKAEGLVANDFSCSADAASTNNSCQKGQDILPLLQFAFWGEGKFEFDGSVEVRFEQDGKNCTLTRKIAQGNEGFDLLIEEKGVIKNFTSQEMLTELLPNAHTLASGFVILLSEFEDFDHTADIMDISCMEQCQKIAAAKTGNMSFREQFEKITFGGKSIVGKRKLQRSQDKMDKQKEQCDWLATVLADRKQGMTTRISKDAILQKLTVTQGHIDRLEENRDIVDRKREQITQHDEIQKLIPDLKSILAYRKQLQEARETMVESQGELNWLEQERQSLLDQMGDLEGQKAELDANEAKKRLLQEDMATAEAMKARNTELAAELLNLQENAEQLEQERGTVVNNISTIDSSIEDTKDSLKNINVPTQSINELMEGVRLSAKVKEVQKQIEGMEARQGALSQEILDKQSQIQEAQKELSDVLEVDRLMLPLKSKDSIAMLLQNNIAKQEMLIKSLEDKQLEIREEVQSLHYNEIEIEQSLECMYTGLNQKQQQRQLASRRQNMIEGAQGMVDMTTVGFIDEHIEELRSEIALRNNRKTEVVAKAQGLKYALAEIERQRQICFASIRRWNQERSKITKSFKDAVARSKNQLVVRYFKAMEVGKATNFVCEIKGNVVQLQTQLEHMREEGLKLDEQKAQTQHRLAYLEDTQNQLNMGQNSIETMMLSSEQSKTAVEDHTDRLVALQSQRRAQNDLLEGLDTKLVQKRSCIAEKMAEKSFNEREIVRIAEKVENFTNNVEESQQSEDEAQRLAYLNDEHQKMSQELQQLDQKILQSKLDIERKQVVVDAVYASYNKRSGAAQKLLAEMKGESLDSIKAKDLEKAEYIKIASSIKQYDETIETLQRRKQSLQSQLNSDETQQITALQESIKQAQAEYDEAKAKLEEAEAEHKQNFQDYVLGQEFKQQLKDLVVKYYEKRSGKQVQEAKTTPLQEVLAGASEILQNMTEGKFALREEEGDMQVTEDGVDVQYAMLTEQERMAVFFAVRLFVARTTCPEQQNFIVSGNGEQLQKMQEFIGNTEGLVVVQEQE